MKFKNIYLEISNSCNFNCSFCYSSNRSKHFMTLDEFQFIADEIRPFTGYIYLHVLGEPLLHPHFQEILKIAAEKDLKVNITTNGSLLRKHKNFLLTNPVRQINISLHDAEENIPKEKWCGYIHEMLDFSKDLAEKSYINFRLWNKSNESSEDFNRLCIGEIGAFFNLPTGFENSTLPDGSVTLFPHIFLQTAPRFQWTTANETEKKKCYGLRDQIAVLSDGSVVPCCIDAGAHLLLGNIFKEKFSDIINSEKAVRIRKGFEQGKAVEEWCRKCGFRV